jgi:hypothetical protein
MCGKMRTFCVRLFINVCKNGIVICREKGYVPTLIVGEEQFIGRNRSRCLLKGTRDGEAMMLVRSSYNWGDIRDYGRTVVLGVLVSLK